MLVILVGTKWTNVKVSVWRTSAMKTQCCQQTYNIIGGGRFDIRLIEMPSPHIVSISHLFVNSKRGNDMWISVWHFHILRKITHAVTFWWQVEIHQVTFWSADLRKDLQSSQSCLAKSIKIGVTNVNYHKTKDKSTPLSTPIFSSLKATNFNCQVLNENLTSYCCTM